MALDILRSLQNGASTALQTFSDQLRTNPQGQVATPSLAQQAPGTVPAGSAQFTAQGTGSSGNDPVAPKQFAGLPTWGWAAIGIGAVVLVGGVILIRR